MVAAIKKDKVLSIKEAKKAFEKQIKKLELAQHYEINSQEGLCLTASSEMFRRKAHEIEELVNNDI